jgi:hypothetical protein
MLRMLRRRSASDELAGSGFRRKGWARGKYRRDGSITVARLWSTRSRLPVSNAYVRELVTTALDNGRHSPRKLLAGVVRRLVIALKRA